MLEYNKKYITALKELIAQGKDKTNILTRIKNEIRIEELENIKGIEESFVFTPDYEDNYPKYTREIMKMILSGKPFKILLEGETQTGKTTLLKIIYSNVKRLYIDNFMRRQPFASTAEKLYNSYRTSENKFLNYPDRDFVFVDDIGAEVPRTAASSAYIGGLLTHLSDSKFQGVVLTTNLNNKQMEEVYEDRVASRLLNNFKIFKFNGKRFGKK